jgi:hypothetical protein
MMIPSMVRAERILLTRKARNEMRKVDGMPIMVSSLSFYRSFPPFESQDS